MPITPQEYLAIANARISQEVEHLRQLEKVVQENEQLKQQLEEIKKLRYPNAQ